MNTANEEMVNEEILRQMRLSSFTHNYLAIQNANAVCEKGFTPSDKLAVLITEKAKAMGFFLRIFVWIVLWTVYDILDKLRQSFAGYTFRLALTVSCFPPCLCRFAAPESKRFCAGSSARESL